MAKSDSKAGSPAGAGRRNQVENAAAVSDQLLLGLDFSLAVVDLVRYAVEAERFVEDHSDWLRRNMKYFKDEFPKLPTLTQPGEIHERAIPNLLYEAGNRVAELRKLVLECGVVETA